MLSGRDIFQPVFVGRGEELGRLKQCLDDAVDGRGNFVLVVGEAGVGKTRIIMELEEYANGKGVNCLNAACFEYSTPYLPFVNALSGVTTLTALAGRGEEIVIDDIFLVYNDGRKLLHETRRLKPEMDSDILAGMFTAVQLFVKDSFGKETKETLDELQYGKTKIPIEHGKYVYLAAVISKGETSRIHEHMRKCVEELETKYENTLVKWDGNYDSVADMKEEIRKLIMGEYAAKYKVKIDPKIERERMFTVIGDLITGMAEEKPIMLFFDDLQWADDSSLALLHYVARTTTNSRILIVGAYRPEELIPITAEEKAHGLTDALRKMKKDRLYKTVELTRLGKDDIEKMLALTFPQHSFIKKFTDAIYSEAGGNPFFTVEMLRSMIEEGTVYKKEDRWYAKDISETVIPETVSAVVLRRIDRLGEKHKKLLGYCSVIGQQFDFKTLQGSTEIEEPKLVDDIEVLLGTKMIRETKEQNYIFDHPVIREVMYADLSSGMKRLTHKKIASSITGLNRDRIGEVVYELANHYYLAGENETALEYLVKAGEKAKNTYALHEAVKYYNQALETLGKLEDTKENKKIRIDILTNLGEMCYFAGELDDAINYSKQSIKICDEIGDEKKKVEASLKIAEILISKAEYNNALENLEKVLKISENIKDTRGMAETYYKMGRVYWRIGKLNEAMDVLNKSLEKSQKIDDKSLIAKAYMDIGTVHVFKGEYNKSIDIRMKSLSISESINDKYEIARAYNNIGDTYEKIGDVDKAIEWYEKCVKIGKEIGWIRVVGYGLEGAAENYVKKNELEKAKEYTEKALTIFEKLGEKRLVGACNRSYGMIYSKEKKWDKAIKHFENSIKIAKEIENIEGLPKEYFEFGKMYKFKNEPEKAKEQFENAIAVYEKLGNKVNVEEVRKEIEKLGVAGEKEIAEELKIQFIAEFVNREKEMEGLKQYIKEAIQGKGRLVLVKGEVGVGKTRLMSEMRNYAKEKGICFVSGRCRHVEGAEPYLPFIDALTEYFQTYKATDKIKKIIQASPPDLVKTIPVMNEIGIKMGITPSGVERGGAVASIQTEKERLFEELTQLIIRISREEPIILLIEDIQWIDTTSLALLYYVARSTKNHNVLLCSTYRPEEIGRGIAEEKVHPAIERFRLMTREGLLTTIELGRLPKDDIAHMIRSMANAEQVPNAIVDFVYSKTEGNPFFVEGVIRSLVAEKTIATKDGKLEVKGELRKVTLPGTTKDIITKSIERLSKENREVLEYAAVLGREFRTDVLRQVTGMDEEKIVSTLDNLTARGLVIEEPLKEGAVYRFYHPLIQEVVYDGVNDENKVMMHNKIGCTIEEMNKENIETVVYELVRHFTNAEEFGKALDYSIRAGDKAKNVFAPDEAINYYNMALESLEKLKDTKENKEKRIATLSNLGEMYYVTGELSESVKCNTEKIGMCDEVGNDAGKAESYLRIGEINMDKAEYDAALENMRKALEIAENIKDMHGTADAYYRMGRVYWRIGKLDDAMSVLNKSLEYSQKIDDKLLMAKAHMDMGLTVRLRGEYDKTLSLYQKSLSISESINDKYEIARAYNNIGDTYEKMGDVNKAIEWYEKCVKISKEITDVSSQGYGLEGAAENYVRKGDLKKAKDYTEQALSIFEKLGDKRMVAACNHSYGMIYTNEKSWDKTIEYFERSIKISKEIGNTDRLSQSYFELGKMYKEKGDVEKAKEMFEKSIAVYEKLGNKVKVEEVRKELEKL